MMASQISELTLVEEDVDTTEAGDRKGARRKSWKSINRLFGALRLAPRDAASSTDNHDTEWSPSTAATKSTDSIDSNPLSPVIQTDTQTTYGSIGTGSAPGQEKGSIAVEKAQIEAQSRSSTLPPYEDAILSDMDDPLKHDDVLDQATAFIESKQNVPDNLPTLARMVLIPRISKGATSPIARVWPPDIADHAISKEDFIEFIDHLNILSQTPPHALALHIAAIGVSFAPFDGADGVAQLTDAAAVAISRYVVHARCASFLDKMNAEYFNPRHLHARLLYSKAMRKVANIPEDDALVAPLAEHTVAMSPHERCVEHMKKYSCELSDDVPPLSPQTQMLARLAAWNVRHKTKQFNKVAMSARKRAWKKHCKGKKLKREGRLEKRRAERLQWLVMQNLEEYELEEAQREEEKMMRKARKTSTWSTIRSGGSDIGGKLRNGGDYLIPLHMQRKVF